jgi:hypothetical protein
MRASELDFTSLAHFAPSEFPEGVLEHVDARLIQRLDEFRDRLGQPIYPSPLAAGWYRTTGSTGSRHYAVGRISDAGDIFPRGNAVNAVLVALRQRCWGGIGIYFDTHGPDGTPWPMLHLDLRPGQQVLWMRQAGRYVYPMTSTGARQEFMAALEQHA